MIQFLDIVPTPLSNYRNYFMHELRNKKKKKMKILTISYKCISDFLKTFPGFEIAIKYPEKQNEIIEQLEFLKNENYKLMRGEWIEQQSNKLIDLIIEKLNRYVAECVGAPVLPTETGLSAFAKKRISLELSAKKVLNVLNEDIMEMPKKYIGNIGDKGQGFIKELVGFINLENYEKYKEYILIKGMNIVPLVKSLGASKKIVVIATHDGNISVRSRPVNSILKLCSNDIYTTYVGSMFTNELVNIENSDDKLSWKEQSIKYLEGGIEAYEDRGYLYE